MGDFLNGLFSTVGPKLQNLQDAEEDARQQKSDMYLRAIQNTNTPDAAYDEAWNQYLALHGRTGKESKQYLQRVKDLTDKVRTSHRQQPTPGGLTEAAAQYGGTPVPWQSLPPDPTPAAAPQAGMSDQRRGVLSKILGGIGGYGKRLGEEFGVGSQRRIDEMREATLAPVSRDIVQAAYPGIGQDFQKKVAGIRAAQQRGEVTPDQANKLIEESAYSTFVGKPPAGSAKLTYRAGVQRPGVDPETGQPYTGTFTVGLNADGQPITWIKEGQKQSAQIRFEQGVVSGSYLKKQLQGGAQLMDVDGNPLRAEDIAPGMVARRVMMNGGARYALEDPHLTTTNFDNTVWLRNPNDPSAPMIPLGAQRLATQGQTEQVIWDPQTQEFKTFAVKRETQPAPAQTAPRVTGQPPAATGAMGPSPAAQRALPPPKQLGGRVVPGVPTGQMNALGNKITPISEAAVQVTGDPNEPNLTPLGSFADLADQLSEQDKSNLAAAIRLAFDAANDATASGHISASAGPISISTGSIGDWIANYFGVPQSVAYRQARMMEAAREKVTNPRAREYFNAVMAAFGTITGLRSLSKASAAQSTVRSLERELPIIGWNVKDSADFADKMIHFIGEIRNAVRVGQIPKSVLPPNMTTQLDEAEKKFTAIKTKSRRGAATRKQVQAGPKGQSAEDEYIDKVLHGTQ